MANLMTSYRCHDVIRGALNIPYDTHQSIIFQTWGRNILYLLCFWKYKSCKLVHFRSYPYIYIYIYIVVLVPYINLHI